MPISTSIISATRNYFSGLAGIRSKSSINSDGNKYELYIYCLTHQAISTKFNLIPMALDSRSKFSFRCSPGHINTSYSYFEFRNIKGDIYELRNGIEVQGHKLEHEIDVSVFINDRTLGFSTVPSFNCLRLAIECKFYKDANSLKGEARKFLGAMSDLSTNSSVPPGGYDNIGCVHHGFNFFRSFVTNVFSNQRPDIQSFLTSYLLYPQFGVLPGTLEEQDFLDRIENYSSTW